MSFRYRANGMALGGELFTLSAGSTASSQHTTLAGEASVLLVNTGGQTSAEVRNFSYAGVAFTRAVVSARGRAVGPLDRPTAYHTVIEASIEELNVFDRLRVERLAIRLTSVHPGPPARTADLGDDAISIQVDEGTVQGLSIDGCGVEVDQTRVGTFHDALSTYAGIVKEARGQKRYVEGRTTLDCCLFGAARLAGTAPRGMEVRAEISRCGQPTDQHDCFILVPGLGKVYIGEVLASKDTRRVNLLRVEVDRPLGPGGPAPAPAARGPAKAAEAPLTQKGNVVAGAVEINGSTYP